MASISRASLEGLVIRRVEGGAALGLAWTEIARASPLVRFIGSGWGEEPDGSLRWLADREGRALRGAAIGEHGVRAALKFEGMQLALLRSDGRTVADLVLRGRAPSEARAWLVEHASSVLGPQVRPGAEPETVGDVAFDAPSEGLNDLADLFDATSALLDRLVSLPGVSGVAAFDEHRLEPGASLEIDGLTVRVSLVQPGRIGGTGEPVGSSCGWLVEAGAGFGRTPPGSLPALGRGSWLEGEGGLPSAVLTLDEAMGEATPEGRGAVLAGFVSGTVNAMLAVPGG